MHPCGCIFFSRKGQIVKETKDNHVAQKRKRLTYEERVIIEDMITRKESLRAIATKLNKSASTISREIRNHCNTEKNRTNDCINRYSCTTKQLCNPTCKGECKKCLRCKRYCSDYVQSFCEKLQEPPYVCNACHQKYVCTYEKKFYHAKKAEAAYRELLVNRRSGFDVTLGELETINDKVSPLIKNGLSPYHIKQVLGDELPISEATLRRMINSCELNARNIDLRSQVKRKQRNSLRSSDYKTDIKAKIGHMYKDYLKYIEENDTPTVQMDCVEGKKDEAATLLTLHFPEFKMQLAFIMDNQDCGNVIKMLDMIEESIGQELFKNIFPVILTDNGHEFSDIQGMERSIYGGKRTRIFFCEPNRSDQKGNCENNHKYIRYIIPKGSSLEAYRQADISLMMNHINSFYRKSLHGKSPYDVAKQILPEDFFLLLGLESIPPANIVLKPSLLH